MSPRAPRLRGSDVCRRLERLGFQCVRIRGSHHFYAKDGVAGLVVVPVHAGETLKPKTLESIARQARLKPHDLAP